MDDSLYIGHVVLSSLRPAPRIPNSRPAPSQAEYNQIELGSPKIRRGTLTPLRLPSNPVPAPLLLSRGEFSSPQTPVTLFFPVMLLQAPARSSGDRQPALDKRRTNAPGGGEALVMEPR